VKVSPSSSSQKARIAACPTSGSSYGDAPDAEKSARFASAEAVRWVEWGLRSYHDFALGLALLLFVAAIVRTAGLRRPIAYLMGLSGLAYPVQGWVVGSEGFSRTHTILILVAWVLSLAWMIWLAVAAWRRRDSASSSRRIDRPRLNSGGIRLDDLGVRICGLPLTVSVTFEVLCAMGAR
jgi:hypothetical protein